MRWRVSPASLVTSCARGTRGDVRQSLVGRQPTNATDIAVVADGRFLGVVPIERLLTSPGDTPIESSPRRPSSCRRRQTSRLPLERRLGEGQRSVAVVDADGQFHGFVPPERLLQVLELEHEEDLARLGGFLRGIDRADGLAGACRATAVAPAAVAGTGLLGAMASAVIVGAFEDEIREQVLLALFLPAVVYMADAVGTRRRPS